MEMTDKDLGKNRACTGPYTGGSGWGGAATSRFKAVWKRLPDSLRGAVLTVLLGTANEHS